MVQAIQRLTTSNLEEIAASVRQGRTRPKKVRRIKDLQAGAQKLRSKIDQLISDIEKRKKELEKAEEEKNKKKDQGPDLPPDEKKDEPKKEEPKKEDDADPKKDGE